MQSSVPKIIIILTMMLIIGGGALFWYSLQSPAPAQPNPQTQNPDTNIPTNPLTTYPQGKPQVTNTLTIAQAYEALFQSMLAQEAPFVSANSGSTGVAAAVYALYAKDIADTKQRYPLVTDFSIPIAVVDLTGDGAPEALAYENLPGFCGSGGCSLDIYQLIQKKWTKIASVLAGDKVGLSNTITSGYLDLFLTVHGDMGGQNKVVRYVWDGTAYQPKETVAVWNGTNFITPRLH